MAGCALTALAGWSVDRSYQNLRNDQIAAQTDSAVTAVKVVLDRVAIAVRAVRGLYAADYVTQEEFGRFAATLTTSEGFRSVGFFRHIDQPTRASYESRFDTEPAKTLGIWEYGPDGKPRRAAERPEYFVVEAGYLLDGGTPSYGFDAASDPERAQAIDDSIRHSELVITGPAKLLGSDQIGALFYVPATDRSGDNIGVATGAISLGELTRLAERTSGVPNIAISVGHGTGDEAAAAKPAGRDSFTFGTKLWTVDVSGAAGHASGIVGWIPLLIIGIGLALTAAVLGYLASIWKTQQINAVSAQLRGMLDGLGPLAWLLTPEGTVVSANRAVTETLKRPVGEIIDRPLWDLPLTFEGTDQSSRIRQAVQQARAGEESRFDFAVEIHGEPRVLDLWVRRLGSDPQTSNLVASAVDVTDRHEAQDTQRLLMRELDHRMKNTLQVIQAIIRRTARSHQSVASFERSLLGRIGAMSRAHELLAGERWMGADIDTIVRQEAGSFDIGGVIRISGPRTRLNPKAALSFALAIHELGTNASKYGGLSSPEGSVDIKWGLERTDDQPWLVLTWQEAGGPRVAPPADRGFGSLLIERSIAYELGGDAKMEFLEPGLRCVIKTPLQSIRPFVSERAPEIPPVI